MQRHTGPWGTQGAHGKKAVEGAAAQGPLGPSNRGAGGGLSGKQDIISTAFKENIWSASWSLNTGHPVSTAAYPSCGLERRHQGGERGLMETVLQAGQRRGTLRKALRFRSGFQLGRHMESGGLTTHGRERPESRHVREMVSKRLYYRCALWASSFFPCSIREHRQQREFFMGKYRW